MKRSLKRSGSSRNRFVPRFDQVERRELLASIQALGAIGDPAFDSYANGISSDGSTVVGSSESSAFRWTAATGMQALGVPQSVGINDQAFGVSGDGSVVVGVTEEFRSSPQAFRWTNSTGMQVLGDLPGGIGNNFATDVSSDGSVIVGTAGNETVGPGVPFRWTALTGMVRVDGMTSAEAVSADGNTIVGTGTAEGDASIWTAAGGARLIGGFPGYYQSDASDISTDGSVVIGYSTGTQESGGFRWTDAAGIQSLGKGPDGGAMTFARAVSGDGSVIVGGNGSRAMIWDGSHGARYLADVLSKDYGLDLTGWELDEATGVSDDGLTIVGNGYGPGHPAKEAWIVHLDGQNQTPLPTPQITVSIPGGTFFGTVPANTQTSKTLTITNTGQAGSQLTGSIGTLTAPFSVISGGGTFSLGANQSLDVGLTYTPGASDTGTEGGVLVISSNDTGKSTLSVGFSGIVRQAVPQISVVPMTIDLGTQWIHEEASQSFAVSNIGDPGTLLRVDLSPIGGPFQLAVDGVAVDEGGRVLVLQAGQSSQVSVTFKPGDNDVGPQAQTFTMVTNDPDAADQNIQVRVTATAKAATPTGLTAMRTYIPKSPAQPADYNPDVALQFAMQFDSNSGDIHDLDGIQWREVLTYIPLHPEGLSYYLPAPFNVYRKEPGPRIKDYWIGSDVHIVSSDTAYFTDTHTSDGFDSKYFRKHPHFVSYQVDQTYQYHLPSMQSDEWLDSPTHFTIVKSVQSRIVSVGKNKVQTIWEEVISKAGESKVVAVRLRTAPKLAPHHHSKLHS
jgi:probable HAF family extracellular repeat protein